MLMLKLNVIPAHAFFGENLVFVYLRYAQGFLLISQLYELKKHYRPRFTRLLKSLLGTKQVCVFQRFSIFKSLSTCIEHELLRLVLSCIRLIIERENLMKWITHKELHEEFLKDPEYRVAYEAELKSSVPDYQIIFHHDDGTEEVVFDTRESKYFEE